MAIALAGAMAENNPCMLQAPASDLEVKEGLRFGRGGIDGCMLALHKMQVSDAAPGKPGGVGKRNDHEDFQPLRLAVASRPNDSPSYFFAEALDLECGRRLLPDVLYKEPPPLIAQLMGDSTQEVEDDETGFTDSDRMRQIAIEAAENGEDDDEPAPKRRKAVQKKPSKATKTKSKSRP